MILIYQNSLRFKPCLVALLFSDLKRRGKLKKEEEGNSGKKMKETLKKIQRKFCKKEEGNSVKKDEINSVKK